MPKIEFCCCLEKGPCSRLTTRQFKTGDTASKKESAATGKIISRFLLHCKVVMNWANKKLSFGANRVQGIIGKKLIRYKRPWKASPFPVILRKKYFNIEIHKFSHPHLTSHFFVKWHKGYLGSQLHP